MQLALTVTGIVVVVVVLVGIAGFVIDRGVEQ
jgi:hypothetical protein